MFAFFRGFFYTVYQEKGCAFSQDHRMLAISSAVKPVIFCHTFPSTVPQLKCGHVYFGWSVNLPLDGGFIN